MQICALVYKGLFREIVHGCEIMLLHFMQFMPLVLLHKQLIDNNLKTIIFRFKEKLYKLRQLGHSCFCVALSLICQMFFQELSSDLCLVQWQSKC